AADLFWEHHGDIFRGRQPELERRWAVTPREANKTSNMAYSSVIGHEYGHFILDELIGNPGAAFGDGFADSFWIIMSGDPIIARNAHSSQGYLRYPGTSGCEYGNIYQTGCECILGGGGHERGQVLGRFWTETLDRFV